jgi:CRISPR-associated endonuclease/helicase Cas3
MIEFRDFSTAITNFTPYQYQIKVAEFLLSGKNVILTVPTGAGKTWASIMPFLYARQSGRTDFPQKMIYSLPLRTLTNSIYSDVSKVLQQKADFEGLTSIHTGEYKEDEHFESDIIFSTIDQTLSNFLCFPLSLSKRQANINAGSLVGSYLVFDEFHLLDPKLSMATTLGTLRTLGTLCRFCIMTATLSEKYINKLKSAVNAEVVSIDDFPEDVTIINSLKVPEGKNFKKTVTVSENTINAETILKHHINKTIVICNRVEKAQRLYNEIITANSLGVDKSNVICLHSHFFDEGRKKKEEDLKRLFGNKNKESAILISTQVIEAGMDISCDTMHVEISPINSFLQRAGRCARWEGQFGQIHVYDILELEEREKIEIETSDKEELAQIRAINNKYLPYNKQLCEVTLEKLKSTKYIDQEISQKLVDDILTEEELKSYSLIVQEDYNRSKIQKSWETCEKNMYSQTIRDIQSIEIAIIDYQQERGKPFIPYRYQTIGLYKWSFIKWMKSYFEEREDGDEYFAYKALDLKNSNFIDSFSFDNDGYKLEPLRNVDDIKGCYDVIFVDKSIFKYTSEAGLELGCGSTCSPLKPYEKKEKEITEYRKDTFEQHNMAIIGCYEQLFKPKLQFTFEQLNRYWGEVVDWDKLIKAMICLHDYGKLNTEWQKKMKKLQELKANGNYNPDEVLAHSDFNEDTDKEIEKISGAKNKPPHAGAGAFALIEHAEKIIGTNIFEELANSISTAILKHHGVDTETYSDFEITDKDYIQIDRLLRDIDVTVNLKRKVRGGNMTDYLPANNDEWVTYFFLARILRLSDQKATIDFVKYIKQ